MSRLGSQRDCWRRATSGANSWKDSVDLLTATTILSLSIGCGLAAGRSSGRGPWSRTGRCATASGHQPLTATDVSRFCLSVKGDSASEDRWCYRAGSPLSSGRRRPHPTSMGSFVTSGATVQSTAWDTVQVLPKGRPIYEEGLSLEQLALGHELIATWPTSQVHRMSKASTRSAQCALGPIA